MALRKEMYLAMNNTNLAGHNSQVQPYIDALMQVSNLTNNQAKTLVYYCIFTWCRRPKAKPLLNINGDTGTGKNSLMKQIKDWCYRPVWIKAENITAPNLRDSLANTGTAFVEEADKAKTPKECEMWLKARYDDTSASMPYNAQRTNAKNANYNVHVTANHFGYTILHTQNPLQSIELDRRIIRIDLIKDTSRGYGAPTTTLNNDVLEKIAGAINWDVEVDGSGGALDCWLPLMKVAGYLEDHDFVNYAFTCVDEKTAESNESKVFEPKGVVLSEIITPYQEALGNHTAKIPIQAISKSIKAREVAFHPDERQVAAIARQLGFEVYHPQNKAHIKVISREHLVSILERQGLSADILTEVSLNEHLRSNTPSQRVNG